MKHPALGPVAAEEPALAADTGGLMRYLTVPNTLAALLLVPLPLLGICCCGGGGGCVCVEVEATLLVLAFETCSFDGAFASSPVGGFMASFQSISYRCSVYKIPFLVLPVVV